ncbi:MAG: sigma factor-like helix-turn-helix DNA-binding protein, partial [Planctomycetota bacterium]|nr:sigma factor-like helix-turn-helix DNA-binding protein [Planctomycetota bacterium]
MFQRYIRQGNPVLMGHLYDRLAPELLTLALHLTKRPSQAEDLVETSHAGQRASTSFTDLPDGDQLPGSHNPVTEAQLSELQEKLDEAVDSLPDHYRRVVQLLVLEGMNSEEVGEALQRPAGTVRS